MYWSFTLWLKYQHWYKLLLPYIVQAYQVPIVNPRCPPKIQEIQFFDISTSDGGDFPRIIEIALLLFFCLPSHLPYKFYKESIQLLIFYTLNSFQLQSGTFYQIQILWKYFNASYQKKTYFLEEYIIQSVSTTSWHFVLSIF